MTDYEALREALADKEVRIKQLESEVLEQCRLNDIGGERELALLAKVERLERENEFAQIITAGDEGMMLQIARLERENAELRERLSRFTNELDRQMRGRDD